MCPGMGRLHIGIRTCMVDTLVRRYGKIKDFNTTRNCTSSHMHLSTIT